MTAVDDERIQISGSKGSIANAAETTRILRHLCGVGVVCVLLALVGEANAADIRDQCADRTANGRIECNYRPHIIEPFTYVATGPYETTSPFLDEDGAKGQMGELIAAKCIDCCDAGRLVSETGWIDAGSGPTWAWAPDIRAGWINRLTYSFSRNCQTPQTVTSTLSKYRYAYCERGWTHHYVVGQTLCSRPVRTQECLTKHPIALPSLAKVFREQDYMSLANQRLSLVRHYRSEGFVYPPGYASNLWHGLGNPWTHNFEGSLFVTDHSVWVIWGGKGPQHFQLPSGSSFPRALLPLRTSQAARLVESSPGTFDYYTADNEFIRFVDGLPTAIVAATGRAISLTHGAVGIAVAQDASGRSLEFGYRADGHLATVTEPSGLAIRYDYKPRRLDSRRYEQENSTFTSLIRVQYPDQHAVEYQSPDWDYRDASTAVWATRITRVIDEMGKEYKRITYSSDGAVASSELAGGAERYSIVGGSLVDPLGSVRSYSFTGPLGTQDGQYQPAGSGCAASSLNIGYDSDGLVVSRDDFNRKRICYTHGLNRNLELVRVDGLVAGQVCTGVLGAGVVLPANSRKVSTEWHPDWRLQTRVAEPGRIVTSVYNGHPDPFDGNVVASCAPATALLPDGKPIAVLCKQVERATTDANGAAGFAAALQPGVPARTTTWTYNRWGQVLTENGPRTDVNDTTTYTYYSDTSFTGEGAAAVGHFMGDLATVTNAAGKVTQYTKYNKHGQVLESVDPNGVVTTHTYDLRQRLLSTTVGVVPNAKTTSYQYDPVGQLKRVTLPDQSWVGYDYDDAHRQVAVYDHKGNRVDYQLDNAGNRIGEQTKDPSGALKRQLNRSIDALGRVQQSIGRE